ncbi:GIY-YIG nuclease family protein [Candidatus Uhrbacteria bacterium]|nr:GIY-YIG nuclease family protein [Candidatus Uhrbacteria bacterium]
MHYTYILQSIVKKNLYIGITDDLKARFTAHNAGEVTSTKAHKPWYLFITRRTETKHWREKRNYFTNPAKEDDN